MRAICPWCSRYWCLMGFLWMLFSSKRISKSPVFACFVYAKAAFDRVNLEKLLDKIRTEAVDRRFIGTLQYWSKVQRFKIKRSSYFSESFPVLNGVRQGGVLLPLLYNLYVGDLNLCLVQTGVGCFIGGVCFNSLSYADDLVILAPTVAALNHLLSICDEFVSANDIVFNTAKTQCMVFIPWGTLLKHIPMAWLSGVSLSFVGSYKYLGITVAPSLSDDLHVKALSRFLCCRANLLIRKFGSCDPSVRCFLFRAYCTPLYGLAFVQSLSVNWDGDASIPVVTNQATMVITKRITISGDRIIVNIDSVAASGFCDSARSVLRGSDVKFLERKFYGIAKGIGDSFDLSLQHNKRQIEGMGMNIQLFKP
ncbi:hypothetical protein QYM36_005577 [Artemia franciscana]|uniref:Reverse transcriptase domain-containing protein n=1 Tax=Artemia franciscana TaxID=6661 RepID=A0AA88I1E0_ARTSF|nr:hypothetical protein QYM36_005577 [Artemia franciscana]